MDWNNLFSGLDRHTLDGITRGSIYALVALGYTMVYGVMKLINFAHSEVFMVGTWTVLGVYTLIGATSDMGIAMIILATLLALVAAMIASAATALAVERIAYRPLRKKGAPPLIFLITGIGCSMVLVETFGQVLKAFFGPPFGRVLVDVPVVLPTKVLFTIPGVDLEITNTHIIIIFGAIVMMVALDFFVNKSRLGRGVRAVAQDPDTASLMGVNHEPRHHARLRPRRRDGRRGRAALHDPVRLHEVRRGIHHRPQGLHRSRPRRHRQPPRSTRRRPRCSASSRSTAPPSGTPAGPTCSPSSSWSWS